MRLSKWILISVLMVSQYVHAKTVVCMLPLVSADADGICDTFQMAPYIPLFSSWYALPACDAIQVSVETESARLSMTPFLQGNKSSDTISLDSRIFVAPVGEKTVVNYNPGTKNTVAPLLIIFEKDFVKAEIHWMRQYSNDSKFGPYFMNCETL